MYRLDNYDLSFSQALRSILCSEYAIRHIQQAQNQLEGRKVHYLLGVLGLIPVLGAVTAIFEGVVFIFTKDSNFDKDKFVAILWYPTPDPDHFFFSHIQLRVGNQEHAMLRGKEKKQRECREEGFGPVRYHFRIKVTSKEYEDLDESLANGNFSHISSCVAYVTEQLRSNTGFHIPIAFSKLPALCAVYLKMKSLLGSSRLDSVERVNGSAYFAVITKVIMESLALLVALPILLIKPNYFDDPLGDIWENLDMTDLMI